MSMVIVCSNIVLYFLFENKYSLYQKLILNKTNIYRVVDIFLHDILCNKIHKIQLLYKQLIIYNTVFFRQMRQIRLDQRKGKNVAFLPCCGSHGLWFAYLGIYMLSATPSASFNRELWVQNGF